MTRLLSPVATLALCAVALAGLAPGEALAHATDRAFIQLMPTGYVIAGGTAAVAASVLILLARPAATGAGVVPPRTDRPVLVLPAPSRNVLSAASCLLLIALLATGFLGSRDPLVNPLPLTIWTFWWIGLPLIQVLVGDIWHWIGPFAGPYRLLDGITGGALARDRLPLPARLGHGPAVVTFIAFAWLEIVDPAPADPERLAVVVSVYAIATFALVCTFGEEAWLGRGDPFAVLFRLIARLSPLSAEPDRESGRILVRPVPPGSKLLHEPALPWSASLLVVVMLGTVSYDALSETFWALAILGINPLEPPGRSALVGLSTSGLLLTVSALALLFFGTAAIGWRWSGRPAPLRVVTGRLVLSILPIAVGFHASHYLGALLVNAQYAMLAANDPFGLGANLLGLSQWHVTTSFLASRTGSVTYWLSQAGLVVAGHLMAVVIAHRVAADLAGRAAWRLELPLAVGMVVYTGFGLWLLSTPTAG